MSAAPDPSGLGRWALLSGRAFDEALTTIIAEHGSHAAIDLRADAFGHGAAEIERRSRARGVTRFIRDGERPNGATPSWAALGSSPSGRPVLSLRGEVVAVKSVAAGTAVSYGYTYRTTTAGTLALVALGYADGVPRSASNRATVRIGSRRGIVAGRVAMDQLVVDLGADTAAVGDDAVLWDDAESLAAWCRATERTVEALTTRLGPRIRRVWSEE